MYQELKVIITGLLILGEITLKTNDYKYLTDIIYEPILGLFHRRDKDVDS